jgi:hypothetical protein
MPIFDLFSKRKKQAARAGEPEVYRYEPISPQFRVKVVHILRDAIGPVEEYGTPQPAETWKVVHDVIAREKGLFVLEDYGSYDARCCNWFLKAHETDDALDFIEVSFRVIDRVVGNLEDYEMQHRGISLGKADAVEELNGRFREEGLGYQYENEELIRVDNQYIHAEVVKPALGLLAERPFEKANEDFMTAHENYRHGQYKDCVVAALRAFESTLKAICTIKRWTFRPGDRASDLIKTVRANGLFPDYLGSGFDSYIAMMKTGLPDVRNNAGGHGEAPAAPAVPSYIAGFALHMTAANILLLGEALKNMSRRGKALD